MTSLDSVLFSNVSANFAPGAPTLDGGAQRPWIHGLAWLTAFLAFLLIAFGGHVTTIGAGDTEPAWSLRFWQWFVPWLSLEGGHFYEMVHRQLGTVVGVLGGALVALLWRRERRPTVRRLGYVLFALMVVQGGLGGLRVLVISDPAVQESLQSFAGLTAESLRALFAIMHGLLGLALWAGLVSLATMTARSWFKEAVAVPGASVRAMYGLSVFTAVYLLVQVILGAYLRHVEWQTGVLLVHMLGGLLVAVLVLCLATVAFGLPRDASAIRRPAFGLAGLVPLQIIMGVFAFALPDIALTRSIHHSTGAIVLALTVMLAVRARHLLKPMVHNENA